MSKVTRVLRPVVHGVIAAVSRGRMVGEDLEGARIAASTLRRRGYEVTLAYWNRSADSPAAVTHEYDAAIDAIRAIGGAAYLSIKAPAFAFDARLFDGLLAHAQRAGVPLHFDSLSPEAADRTFSFIADRTLPWPQAIGCTLPGRWKRSPHDAARLADLDMAFRVVKGEWPDPEAPAVDPGRGFLDVVTHLAGRARSVRIATHDSRLAKQSVQILRDAGTPCDLELLYGFPVRKLLPEALKLGIPIRIYVPFGHGWIPYCAGYVRRRPAFMWWLIRDSLAGRYQDSFSQVEPPTAR